MGTTWAVAMKESPGLPERADLQAPDPGDHPRGDPMMAPP